MLHLPLMHIQVLCEEFIFVEYFPTYWAWERFADFAMHRSFVSLQIGRIPLSKQKIQYDDFESQYDEYENSIERRESLTHRLGRNYRNYIETVSRQCEPAS